MTFSWRPTLNATRARQGRLGRPMLWVLLFGTLLAAIGLFAAWTWKASDLSAANSGSGPSKAAAAFNSPEPGTLVRQGWAGQASRSP